MKFSLVPAVLAVIISLAGFTPAKDNKNRGDTKSSEKIERTMPIDSHASITLCVMSGKIVVRGWEKNELRVRSTDADQLEFRPIDKAKEATTPATRVDVMVNDKHTPRGDCQALADVEMDVPKDATVQVQTRDGDIFITGVAGAYAGSQNGDIMIDHVSSFVEAGSVGGSISLENSTGRVSLSSAGGGVEVANVKAVTDDDTFEVGTVSGDIQLNQISNPKVSTKTVNGAVTLSGPLARAGNYSFTTMGGDVVLMIPTSSSFTLNAKVSQTSDIVSDFPLKYTSEMPSGMPAPKPMAEPAPPTPKAKMKEPKTGGPVIAPIVVVRPVVVINPFRRITAVYGSGDATISLNSFGGTLRLKKM
ncbi:MAG TPA: DUF4097 family beta strand repeat-containing protein [Pyrinomonadaceae bacterium]